MSASSRSDTAGSDTNSVPKGEAESSSRPASEALSSSRPAFEPLPCGKNLVLRGNKGSQKGQPGDTMEPNSSWFEKCLPTTMTVQYNVFGWLSIDSLWMAWKLPFNAAVEEYPLGPPGGLQTLAKVPTLPTSIPDNQVSCLLRDLSKQRPFAKEVQWDRLASTCLSAMELDTVYRADLTDGYGTKTSYFSDTEMSLKLEEFRSQMEVLLGNYPPGDPVYDGDALTIRLLNLSKDASQLHYAVTKQFMFTLLWKYKRAKDTENSGEGLEWSNRMSTVDVVDFEDQMSVWFYWLFTSVMWLPCPEGLRKIFSHTLAVDHALYLGSNLLFRLYELQDYSSLDYICSAVYLWNTVRCGQKLGNMEDKMGSLCCVDQKTLNLPTVAHCIMYHTTHLHRTETKSFRRPLRCLLQNWRCQKCMREG